MLEVDNTSKNCDINIIRSSYDFLKHMFPNNKVIACGKNMSITNINKNNLIKSYEELIKKLKGEDIDSEK